MKQRATWRTSRHITTILSGSSVLSVIFVSASATYNWMFKAYNGVATPLDGTDYGFLRAVFGTFFTWFIVMLSYLDSEYISCRSIQATSVKRPGGG
jgi:hypothetical protein